MNYDGDAGRRTVELCYRTNKTIVNRIIDWTDEDVWEFLRAYKIPYCELYNEGFKRLGCIGCPLGGPIPGSGSWSVGRSIGSCMSVPLRR